MQRGYKVINLEHLPGHDIDVSPDHPNLYWPFGQHILSGAKLIAHHPNLYAVYLTNHGCGPDTMLSHLFREEMGDKPYLQIEVDEHFSKVGVITRIEAFLNSLNHREAQPLPEDFRLMDVRFRQENMGTAVQLGKTVLVPDLGVYTKYLCQYIEEACGVEAEALPPMSRLQLVMGRTETASKEYLPFTALLGSVLYHELLAKGENSYLIPSTEGAEADGQYARAIRAVLNRRGNLDAHILAPVLETLPLHVPQPELLFRALITGDLLYMSDPAQREALAPDHIPDEAELLALAETIGRQSRTGRRIAAVGTPLCLTSLNEGVLEQLEREGEHILRSLLSETLLFQWQEHGEVKKKCRNFLTAQTALLSRLAGLTRENSSFCQDQERLHQTADAYLPTVSGGNARYRFAKAIELGKRCGAVLSLAPPV